jgi:uncharacterized protein YyaL (SSP411 family)
LDYFYDESRGLFSFTSRLDPKLVSGHFEIEDNVIPASNSVIAKNLLRLSTFFTHMHYRTIAKQMIDLVTANVDYPSAFSNWLDAFLNVLPNQVEVAICGPKAIEFAKKLQCYYLPNVCLAASESPSDLPFLSGRFDAKVTQFYLCQNQHCELPYTDFEALVKRLQEA